MRSSLGSLVTIVDSPSLLLSLPPEGLANGFEDRLGALPPEEQDAWIRAADAIAHAGPETSWRAEAVYWALRDRLDPTAEADQPRILLLLQSLLDRDEDLDAFAKRVACANVPAVQQAARLIRAQVALRKGRIEEAEHEAALILEATRGSGDQEEHAAMATLGATFAVQGREFEALIMAQRGVDRARDGGRAWRAGMGHLILCEVYRVLQDADPLEQAVTEFSKALRASPAPWAWRFWRYVHAVRAEIAIDRHMVALARGELARARAVVPSGRRAGISGPHWEDHLEARILQRVGDAAEALEIVPIRDLRQHGHGEDFSGLLIAARCALDLGDAAQARAFGERLLSGLADSEVGPYRPGSGLRVALASRVGGIFHGHEAFVDLAGRAFDLASRSTLLRLGELQRCIRDLPELGDVSGEETRLLERYRERFIGEHATFLTRLIPFLTSQSEGPGSILDSLRGEGLLRVCAWCHRVRQLDGTWLPIGHFIPDRSDLDITHGVCPACQRAVVQGDR